MIKYLFFITLGIVVTACSSSFQFTSAYTNKVLENAGSDVTMDSLVAPFSRSLSKEMNQVIATSSKELAGGRPNSLLGNFVTDALIDFGKDSLSFQNEPVICIINAGGLRASLPQGNITIGDVFRLMPFDNEIVALKIDKNKLIGFIEYTKVSGGDPISGFNINKDSLIFTENALNSSYIWVITSDFLANGGDKMSFFQLPLERKDTKVLLRDYLIHYIESKKEIKVNEEQRIIK